MATEQVGAPDLTWELRVQCTCHCSTEDPDKDRTNFHTRIHTTVVGAYICEQQNKAEQAIVGVLRESANTS